MNRFGRYALENWKTLAPSALSRIPDPSSHFSQLGIEAESRGRTCGRSWRGRTARRRTSSPRRVGSRRRNSGRRR